MSSFNNNETKTEKKTLSNLKTIYENKETVHGF